MSIAKMPLSSKVVETARAVGVPAGKSHLVVWDKTVSGFGLRLRQSGAASFIYYYRPKGGSSVAPITLTIGSADTMTAEQARAQAKVWAGTVAAGGDPRQQQRDEAAKAEKAKQASRMTVRASIDDYGHDLAHRHIVKRGEVVSALHRGFKPVIDTEISLIDFPAMQKLVRDIPTTGAAARFESLAKTFLLWAVEQKRIAASPYAFVRVKRRSRAQRLAAAASVRQRALDDNEITAVWNAAQSLGQYGLLVRFALLTGLRRNELAVLKWEDITASEIVVPAEVTKMGREHRVPLTNLMRTVLSSVPRTTSDYVFASMLTNRPMSGWSKMLPRLLKAAGTAPFSLHDLRRTCRTLMSRCGIDDLTAELAIGHARVGLVGLYNKDQALPARQKAFEAVSAHVATLAGGAGSPIPVAVAG